MDSSRRVQTADFPLLQAARSLWAAGCRDDALVEFERAVASQPDNVRGLVESARALGQQYRIAPAETLLNRATQLAADDPDVVPVIAQSYRLIHRPERAMEYLEKLCQSGSLSPPLLGELAVLYEQMNRLEEAESTIRQCIDRAGGQAEPQLVLARIQRARGDLPAAASLLDELTRRAAASELLSARAWSELCYVRDELGDYESAAAAIEQSKEILRRQHPAASLARRAEAINETFRGIYSQLTTELIDDWRAESLPADPRCLGIAHLLGFPRSGTTLLEQLLEAHPQVAGSPERLVFTQTVFPEMCRQADRHRLTLEALRTISNSELRRLRTHYLDCMESIRGEALAGRVHLDKNPNHTSLTVGLVRLFPESRFLVALRDPRDVIVSSYLRFFPLTEFSAMLLTWEGTCRQYCFEMSVWRTVRELIGSQALQVHYEDVVERPYAECRRTLELLGLDWDDRIEAYRDAIQHKLLHSPSQAEVRKPIDRRPIGRWKNYERYVAPLLDRLSPYLEAFGYG